MVATPISSIQAVTPQAAVAALVKVLDTSLILSETSMAGPADGQFNGPAGSLTAESARQRQMLST
jgi:hypothetical protein